MLVDCLLLVENADAADVVSEGIRAALNIIHLRLATSLADARMVVRRERVDLVLQEVQLPDGEGAEAVRSLRRDYDGPLIVVTAARQEGLAAECLQAGADDFLTKPLTASALRKAVLDVAARHRARRTACRIDACLDRLEALGKG